MNEKNPHNPRFRRYPEYKDSDVEWIGKIPKHWNLVMLKYKARLVYGDSLISENREDGVVPVYGSNGIIDSHSSANTLSPTIIVGRKGSLGKVQYSDVPCFVIDTAYYIDKRTSKVNLRWLCYVLQTLKLERFRNSVLPGLNRESAETQHIPLIRKEEQTQIANFLDRKTEQIDELIRIKERRIELLQEQRTALINQAVTKGLDPNVEMKPSGVEWIGEIPRHWTITRLKYLGESIIGLTYKPEEITDEKNGILVLRASNIRNGKPSFLDNVYVNAVVDEKLYLKTGDILICSRSGSRELIGKNITITEKLEGITFGVFMTVFRTKYYRFISCFLNSQIFKNQSGLFLTSTVNQLTINTLNNFLICFPTEEDEQSQIANYLDNKTHQIDELISTEHRKIELLKEYRQSLISEAVTGKIDVRNEV